MKKVLALVMVVLFALSTVAMAEVDVENMTDEDLRALQTAISQELDKREKARAENQPTEDYLYDEKRLDIFHDEIFALEFDSIRQKANDYIESVQPDETDSAYAIIKTLDAIDQSLEPFEIEIDEFDGTWTAHYPGLTDISEEYCIVPYIKPNEYSNYKMGFIADEWVFFRKVMFSADGMLIGEREYKSTEIEEKVLRGEVTEWTSGVYSLIDVDEEWLLSDEHTIKIRFLNETKDTKYDHTLTSLEKEACYYHKAFLKNMGALYKIWSDYDLIMMKAKLAAAKQ